MSIATKEASSVLATVRKAIATGNVDPLLSVAEVIALTGFKERTLRRYVAENILEHERIGPSRRIYFRWSVIRREWPEDARRL